MICRRWSTEEKPPVKCINPKPRKYFFSEIIFNTPTRMIYRAQCLQQCFMFTIFPILYYHILWHLSIKFNKYICCKQCWQRGVCQTLTSTHSIRYFILPREINFVKHTLSQAILITRYLYDIVDYAIKRLNR